MKHISMHQKPVPSHFQHSSETTSSHHPWIFSLLLSLGLEVRPVTAPGIARYQFQSFINPKPNMSKLDLVHFWVVINQDKKVYFWIFVIHFKSYSN